MKNERLQKWALITEIGGGFAILITLIAVLIELDANTKATQAQTAQELWNQLLQATTISDALGAKEQVELTLEYLNSGFEGMEFIEGIMAESQFERVMQVYDNAYYQYARGILDEDVFARFRDPIMDRVQRPWFEDYWERKSNRYSLSFREYIDELLLSLREE